MSEVPYSEIFDATIQKLVITMTKHPVFAPPLH